MLMVVDEMYQNKLNDVENQKICHKFVINCGFKDPGVTSCGYSKRQNFRSKIELWLKSYDSRLPCLLEPSDWFSSL